MVGGGSGTLGALQGPAVVMFWAPWCPHCIHEVPVLDIVAADFPDVNVISVAIWGGKQPGPTPQEVVDDTGVSYRVYLDDATDSIAGACGITSTPMIYVLGADRQVITVASGAIPEQDLRETFAALG